MKHIFWYIHRVGHFNNFLNDLAKKKCSINHSVETTVFVISVHRKILKFISFVKSLFLRWNRKTHKLINETDEGTGKVQGPISPSLTYCLCVPSHPQKQNRRLPAAPAGSREFPTVARLQSSAAYAHARTKPRGSRKCHGLGNWAKDTPAFACSSIQLCNRCTEADRQTESRFRCT